MKKLLAILMTAAFAFAVAPAFADHDHSSGQCPMSKSSCDKCSKSQEHACPVVNKFMKKAHFLLDNSDEIGLSGEQVAQIKAMKMDMKKSLIRQEAEMQIGMMDMKAKLSEDVLDVEGLNAMIDQGMAGMADGAKKTVQAYSALKAVLSPEQMAKAKAIWEKKKED